MQETKNATSEVSFISELHDGKSAALQLLFDKYYKPLCYYANRIVKDKYLAEDIVAVSIDKIWRRRKNFDHLPGLLSYLYTITKNESLDQLALLRRRRMVHEDLTYLSETNEDTIHNKMTRTEVLRSILAKTETLPPKTKEVFDLIYLDGLSISHVAEKIGVSLNTVKTQQAVGLRKLRAVCLKNEMLEADGEYGSLEEWKYGSEVWKSGRVEVWKYEAGCLRLEAIDFVTIPYLLRRDYS